MKNNRRKKTFRMGGGGPKSYRIRYPKSKVFNKRQYATLMICWIFSTFLSLCFGFQMIVYKDHQVWLSIIPLHTLTSDLNPIYTQHDTRTTTLALPPRLPALQLYRLSQYGLTLMAVSIKSALSSRKLEKRA